MCSAKNFLGLVNRVFGILTFMNDFFNILLFSFGSFGQLNRVRRGIHIKSVWHSLTFKIIFIIHVFTSRHDIPFRGGSYKDFLSLLIKSADIVKAPKNLFTKLFLAALMLTN